MGFYEISWPVTPTVGTDGGPGFDTSVLVMDSGQERRIQRRANAQHRFNGAFSIKTLDDVYLIREHYLKVGGVANGFRYLDYQDYASTANGRDPTYWEGETAVDSRDQLIGTGDGSETVFQLVKNYGTAPDPIHTRTITKPISGTVTVSIDGVTQASGWSVDTTTGLVTFTSAPGSGLEIAAGYLFEVPVRFGEEVDELLRTVIESYGSASVPQIPLVELMNESPADEHWLPGGAESRNVAANITLSQGLGKVKALNVTAGGLKATLPDFTNLSTGGLYFMLIETGGAQSLAIHDEATDTLQFTLSASGQMEIYLGLDNASAKKWYAV